MRRIRFSIRSLVVFILICGVGLAALKESTEWWEKGTFSVTVLCLLTSVLLAIHGAGERKAFWIGFALFGFVYLGLSLIPPAESRLISSQGLAWLRSKLPGQKPQTVVSSITVTGGRNPTVQTIQNGTLVFSSAGTTLSTLKNSRVRLWNANTGKPLGVWGGSEENFVKIGHCLVALVLACVGGTASRRLAVGRWRPDERAELDGVASITQ